MSTKKSPWRPNLIPIAAVVLVVAIAIGLNGLVPKSSTAGIGDTLNSVINTIVNTLAKDGIYSRTYAQLPTDIRKDLNNQGFYGNEVKAMLEIHPSLATRVSSVVLNAANAISRVADLAIGKAISPTEFDEAIQLTAVKEGIAKIGGPAADITLIAVSLSDGAEIARQVYQVARGATDVVPANVAAKAAAWVLDSEMRFINNRVSGAYQNILGKSNLWFVWAQAGKQSGNVLDKRGMLCYYYNPGSKQYLRYFSDAASIIMTVKKK